MKPYFLDKLAEYERRINEYSEDGAEGVALHIFDTINIEHNFALDVGAATESGSK